MVTIFDAALAQMAMNIEEMRRALVVTGQITPEISTQNTQRTTVNTQLREVASQGYMSGRWHRRDGDGYGTLTAIPKPTAALPGDSIGGHRKAGDL